jgi:hypothetical protein
MPRNDALVLSDLNEPTLTIVCQPCGRRGRYNVARLIERYGDAKLPGLRAMITDCSKAGAVSFRDPCRARYEWPER